MHPKIEYVPDASFGATKAPTIAILQLVPRALRVAVIESPLILPLNFPLAPKVSDQLPLSFVPFCLTCRLIVPLPKALSFIDPHQGPATFAGDDFVANSLVSSAESSWAAAAVWVESCAHATAL
ncbi:hypothetical protein [Candidatus Binatus sp.]|uniref:hypothetical protein n=1 Tax=Candidatus Binatus sp. TaxID=2811406 RepID=UPI002F428448